MVNFKSVNEFDNLVELKENESLVGKYLGKSNYHSESKNRDFPIHKFLNEAGVEVVMFGSGSLDYLLNKVQAGSLTRVTYLGLTAEEVETDHGMKKIHQYKVEIAS